MRDLQGQSGRFEPVGVVRRKPQARQPVRRMAKGPDAFEEDGAAVVNGLEGIDPGGPVARAEAGGRWASWRLSLSWTWVVVVRRSRLWVEAGRPGLSRELPLPGLEFAAKRVVIGLDPL